MKTNYLFFKELAADAWRGRWCGGASAGKRLLACALVMMLCVPLSAQTGKWSGDIDVQGMKLGLVFNIKGDSCTLDVPVQGAYGIAAEMSKTQEGDVKISIPIIGAVFEGRLDAGRIAGTFTQHGMAFPLTLHLGAAELKRPQTPVAPFPYTEEEVSFTNGDATLSGTLTLPQGCSGDTPVLLMITGSGQQDRDETVFGHKPFAVIADAFARRGIATLRYDDRGFAKSTGDVVNSTTEDFKNDALAGIDLLRKRFRHVGVIGHSEGGTIAFMLAASGKADFIISLAGMTLSGKETILMQNRNSLANSGVGEQETEQFVGALSVLFDSIVKGEQPPAGYADGLADVYKQTIEKSIPQVSTPYMKYFLSLDISPLLGKVKCPVMALNGTMDKQVDCAKNIDVLRKGLTAAPHRIEACEGLNHLFQHCKTGQVVEYDQIEETFSPDVITAMGDWVLGLF